MHIMKYSTAILGVLALSATEVIAFPTALFDMMARAEDSATLESAAAAIAALKEKRFVPRQVGFNAATQYVSIKGLMLSALPTSLPATNVVPVLACSSSIKHHSTLY